MAEDAPAISPSSSISPTANEPSKTGYDPARPWSNLWNLLSGRMSQLGQFYYREDTYIRREKEDCKNCEEWRDWCFKYSPIVIFLQKNINDLNGDLNPDNVRCRRLPARILGISKDENGDERVNAYRQPGGFSPDHGILLCANELRDRKHLEDTLAHEMVHAWDHLRWKVDWADLRHAACTEIRASSLSGECRWTREFFTRNNFTITQQHQNCVRMRAVKSVMARPSCKDDVQAVKVVNEVWDSCFADTRPFDEIYR